MNRPRFRLAVVAAVFGVAAVPIAPTSVGAQFVEPGNPSEAVYDGETIDLSEGWGTARACAELGSVTECYDTLAELLAAHPELGLGGGALKGGAAITATALVNCATTLRLYDGTSYSGTVLILSTRGIILNLSAYGFDNKASSYKNGACATNMYTGATAGGSSFTAGANVQSSSMPAGFNNTVSSVYIS